MTYLTTNTTELLPTTKLWRQQQDRQTIDTPTNNDTPTDIWITKDGSKRTNHVLQCSQPITSRLNWQTTNNIASSSNNQDNGQRLITSTDDSQFTWLWWWLPLRLSKRQSMSPQIVLLRTTPTWTMVIYRLMLLFSTSTLTPKNNFVLCQPNW